MNAALQDQEEEYHDSSLYGVAGHIRLLLNIMQDHHEAGENNKNDGGRMLRVATMMTIIQNIKSRIQKCQSKYNQQEETYYLMRSNSNLSAKSNDGKENQPGEIDEEKESLRKALNTSLYERRTIQTHITSLSREKDIMTKELSKKVNLLNAMEELIYDLEIENEIMINKLIECKVKHPEVSDVKPSDLVTLQEMRSKFIEQTQCVREEYKMLKRKAKALQEENNVISKEIVEIKREVKAARERLNGMKERSNAFGSSMIDDIREQINGLEQIFECFRKTTLNKTKRQNSYSRSFSNIAFYIS